MDQREVACKRDLAYIDRHGLLGLRGTWLALLGRSLARRTGSCRKIFGLFGGGGKACRGDVALATRITFPGRHDEWGPSARFLPWDRSRFLGSPATNDTGIRETTSEGRGRKLVVIAFQRLAETFLSFSTDRLIRNYLPGLAM